MPSNDSLRFDNEQRFPPAFPRVCFEALRLFLPPAQIQCDSTLYGDVTNDTYGCHKDRGEWRYRYHEVCSGCRFMQS